jgi:hypothetical protein
LDHHRKVLVEENVTVIVFQACNCDETKFQ